MCFHLLANILWRSVRSRSDGSHTNLEEQARLSGTPTLTQSAMLENAAIPDDLGPTAKTTDRHTAYQSAKTKKNNILQLVTDEN